MLDMDLNGTHYNVENVPAIVSKLATSMLSAFYMPISGDPAHQLYFILKQ